MALPLPPILKSPYVLGSAGVVGIGGVSTVALSVGGGGVDYSQYINSNEGIKSRKNLISSTDFDNSLKEGSCFKKFFGDKGLSFSHTETPTETEQSPTASETPGDSSGSVSACTLSKFESLSKKAVTFQTELSVKDDKVGFSLWALGKNFLGSKEGKKEEDGKIKLQDQTQNTIQYYLFLMEKKDSNWFIQGGYSWKDASAAQGFKNNKLYVKMHGEVWSDTTYAGVGSSFEYVDSEWNHKMYYGTWTGGSGSQSVFDGIEIWVGDKNKAEIFGRDMAKNFDDTKSEKGYDTGDVSRPGTGSKYVNGKWEPRMYIKELSSLLDRWFAPFKDKKGTWKASQINGSLA